MSRSFGVLLVVVLGLPQVTTSYQSTKPPNSLGDRRAFLGGLTASAAWLSHPAASLANKISGLPDRPNEYGGSPDQTPFNAVIENVRKALEAVGVEGAPQAPALTAGPKVERPYLLGRRKGSDRLNTCPSAEPCLSSSADEKTVKTSPYLYFTQKGDALGGLLALIDDDPKLNLLGVDGNFFNGAGVYVLCERSGRNGVSYDCEFNFLPGVLESLVDVRVIQRGTEDGSAASASPPGLTLASFTTGGAVESPAAVVDDFARRMKWITLESGTKKRDWKGEEEEIFKAAEIEWKIRNEFERELEDADNSLQAQMDDEQRRVETLKTEIGKLLDQLAAQDDKRERESRNLRLRVVEARETYYQGVLKRQGSYLNSGSYGGRVSALSSGNSLATQTGVGQDTDITAKILNRNTAGNAQK